MTEKSQCVTCCLVPELLASRNPAVLRGVWAAGLTGAVTNRLSVLCRRTDKTATPQSYTPRVTRSVSRSKLRSVQCSHRD